MISYIVSAYDRPLHLLGSLSSLLTQTHRDFEIIVTDNAPVEYCENISVLRFLLGDAAYRPFNYTFKNMRYVHTAMDTCYQSAEHGASIANGEWLCFPSDDSYYVPDFAKLMLEKSAGADLVYCDCIYDPRRGYTYAVMDTKPLVGHIDKTNFIVRKEWFERVGGFPEKKPGGCSDGLFIERAIQLGARHVKAEGVLCFHN